MPPRFSLTPYLFLLPAVLLLGITTFGPVGQAIFLSFTSYDFIGPARFVGLQNYADLWRDRLFWKTLGNTLVYLIVAVPCLTILPLGLAILANQRLRGMSFFRVLYYVPVVVSEVVAGLAWKWIYAENGLLNGALSAIAGHPVAISWLSHPRTAIVAVIAVTVWRGLGYYMTIYLAGLQAIPQELYDAAAIDGSDGWRQHLDITVPLMRPYILLVVVVSAIAAMKIFEEPYVMTRGGPANATKTLVYYLFEKGIGSFEMGYASAIGVVLFLLVFAVSLLAFRLVMPSERGFLR